MDLSGLDSISPWSWLIAAGVIIASWIISIFVRKGVLALMRRAPGVDESVAQVTARVVKYVVILLGVGIAFALLGADIQPLVAIAIVVGVVLALVLRGVADNFAAGVLIQARRSVELGDEIVVEGPDGVLSGTVTELNSRAVVLLTVDGRTAHVPNAKVLQDAFLNDSRHGARRSEVQVRVARADRSVDEMLEVLTDAVQAAKGVHARESVAAVVHEITPDRLAVSLQFWHHPMHAATVSSDVVRALGARVDGEGWTATVTSDRPAAPLVPPDRV